MIDILYKKDCCGCSACLSVCPKRCITMQADEEGFLYPVVDKEKCIECDRCKVVCPVINAKDNVLNSTAYAAYNKDLKTRMASTSGGVFTLIATKVLNEGGVVFGAAFDEQFNVVHKAVKTVEELECLRVSKYTQSRIGKTYSQAKQFLNDGIIVLFTGTPCQINGLYSFLGKEYDNLITQDLICHGVPSPGVWRKYLDFKSKQCKSYPKKLSFRDKRLGWKSYSLSIQFKNNTKYSEINYQDPMLRAFTNDLCLRPSCYDCKFRAGKGTHISDIKLADFWGVEHVCPELDDDKGTSLVIVNTPKGAKLFESIKDCIIYKQVDFAKATKYNPSMFYSCNIPKNRNAFMKEIFVEPFDKVVDRYVPKRRFIFLRKVKRWLKRIIKKITK